MSVAVSRRFSLAAPDLTALEFVEDATPLTAVTASPQQQSIYRLTWPNDTLATPVPMLAGRFGSIREVAVAPDGSIYATTANQPGSDTRRGDLLIRVIPR
jgi:hypothetical protein